VKAGAEHPDIATEPALRAALWRRVRWRIRGSAPVASCFAQLIERLGIAREINARAVIIPQGFTARTAREWRGPSRRATDQRWQFGPLFRSEPPARGQTPACWLAVRSLDDLGPTSLNSDYCCNGEIGLATHEPFGVKPVEYHGAAH